MFKLYFNSCGNLFYYDLENKPIEYQLGSMLISYTNIDIKAFHQKVDTMLYDICKVSEPRGLYDFIKRIEQLLNEVSLFHPYLNSFTLKTIRELEELEVSIDDNVFAKEEDNGETIFDSFYSILKKMLSFLEIQFLFKEAIDFCFINQDEAFKNLNNKQRLYLFQRRFNSISTTFPQINYNVSSSALNKFMVPRPPTKIYNARTFIQDRLVEEAEEISKVTLDIFEEFNVADISGALYLEFIKMISFDTTVKVCANCNKYFIPSSRSDEIYCDNIYKNNRTCKQLGYEQKINKDEYMKAYRTAYKTKNAQKLRNINNSPSAEEKFKNWVSAAKLKLDEAQNGNISLDDFKKWLKE